MNAAGDSADLGLIGLGVMGQNLALNFIEHGYRIAALEPLADRVDGGCLATAFDDRIQLCLTLPQLVERLQTPRALMLMITAGAPVDEQLEALLPLLSEGDAVIDGGNSHYQDTIRRGRRLGERGVHYIGLGVSGGEQGARTGASLMAGGSEAGFRRVEPLLQAIAARVDDEPCCAYLGADAAGHFVKMIHNGIEYADLQLIAEIYDLLRRLNVPYAEMSRLFAEWNRGELRSYLIEITAQILAASDQDSEAPLVESILDRAGEKGTGRWASLCALELGVPAPTIIEAVGARALSALKEQRVVAGRLIEGKTIGKLNPSLVAALPDALMAAKVCAYAQGFTILRAAGIAYRWQLPFQRICRIWRGGCIIRAAFLDNIGEAFERNAEQYNLLLDPYFQLVMQRTQLALRRVVASATAIGVPVPALSSALAYFDAYRSANLPANLIQAQRDYFGAHGYQRTDRPGVFHTDWRSTG